MSINHLIWARVRPVMRGWAALLDWSAVKRHFSGRVRDDLRLALRVYWEAAGKLVGVAYSRIAIQWSLAAVVLIVFVLGLIGGVLIREQRRVLLSEMQSKCDLFVRSLSIVIREAYYPRPDLFFLTYLAEETLKEEWIRGISLFDKDGRMILVKRKDAPALLSENVSVVRPIVLKGAPVGKVEMVFSTKPVKRAQAAVARRIAFIALGTVAVGLILIIGGVPFLVRPILDLANAAARVGKGDFDAQVRVSGRNELGMLQGRFNDMVRGLKEREIIRASFGRYFSPQVARAILEDGISLKGERKEVTLLLSDIRGFTGFSEKLPPEEVVGMLNEFFSTMVRIIHDRQGTVDKFIGDAILAVFGAPIAFENHAFQAVSCAVAMREALREFNDMRARNGRPGVQIGIALNTGNVVAGNLGAYEKSEYTVIGDTVNLVSRMEGLNKRFGTDILVSRATHERIKDWFACEPLGVQQIRGRREPVDLFAVKSILSRPGQKRPQ